MTPKKFVEVVGIVGGIAGFVLVGALISATRLHADDGDKSSSDEARIEQGLHIAPVHLTYARHNRKLVGLGSYLVNAVSECIWLP